MTTIGKGSANVYADLGYSDADGMLAKAHLATQIRHSISVKKWSQADACKALGLNLIELSDLLGGKFRSISKAKMTGYLARLETKDAER